MILQRIFGQRRRKPSLRNLDLDGEGLTHEADHEGVRVWRTEEDDAVGVYFFNIPPDLPLGQSSEQELLNAYSASAQSHGVSIVDLEIYDVGWVSGTTEHCQSPTATDRPGICGRAHSTLS